jgi:hypothetical protein
MSIWVIEKVKIVQNASHLLGRIWKCMRIPVPLDQLHDGGLCSV